MSKKNVESLEKKNDSITDSRTDSRTVFIE